MRKHSHRITLQFILFVMVLFWALPAFGHKVSVFAWVEGDTVYTESRFSAGKMVQNGKIEVYDMQGNKLLEGTTDDQGLFNFPVPSHQDIKIVLIAGMGHSNQWIVKADELSDATVASQSPAPQPTARTEPTAPAAPTPSTVHAAPTPAPNVPPAGTCVDASTVERIVNLALEKKLGLLESRLIGEGPKFREIVAGFGYILGLVGLAAYMRFRKTGR